jgi:DNA replication initiation complex subunit (GINS family)
MAGDIKITFDTLFSILRNEKGREEMQELDPSFYKDVIEYLNEKKDMISKETDGLNVFISNERERNIKQLSNIKKILNDIYERRERKIIDMALVKSRTKSDVISTSGLLEPEAKLYEKLLKIFDGFRSGVLYNILEGKEAELKEETAAEERKAEQEQPEKSMKKVKFLHEIPKFVGENLEVYGPFGEQEIAELPTEIANLLVLKGRAQDVIDAIKAV